MSKKLVSATLAGALAVGMVPAMALADEAPELELLVTETQAIQSGTVILAAGQTNGQAFKVTDEVPYLVPVAVQPLDTEIAAAQEPVTHFTVYKLDKNGTPSENFKVGTKFIKHDGYAVFTIDSETGKAVYSSGTITSELEPGSYAVGVYAGGTFVTQALTFTVDVADVTGLAFFDDTNEDPDLTDTTITFDGYGYGLGEGLGLKIGSKDVTEFFEIEKVTDPETGKTVEDPYDFGQMFFAGTYNVKLVGEDDYEGVEKTVKLVINPLEISKLDIAVENLATAEAEVRDPQIVAVNGDESSDLLDILEITKLPDDITEPGSYKATIGLMSFDGYPAALKASFEKSISGTKTVEFLVAEEVDQPISVTYGGKAIADNGSTVIEIDYSDDDEAFDASDIVVTYLDYDDDEQTAKAAEKVITYLKVTDEGFESAEADDLKNPGTYVVSVSLKATDDQAFETDKFTVKVTNGALDDANISVTLNGLGVYENQTKQVTYNGTDFLAALNITVRDAEGKVVSPSAYSVKAMKTAPAQGGSAAGLPAKADKIVDAGTYEVTIESAQYDLEENVYTIEVLPAEVTPVLLDQKTGEDYADIEMFYTGKAIDVVAKFTTEVNGKDVDIDVPASAYKVGISAYDHTGELTQAPAAADSPLRTQLVKLPGSYTITFTDVPGDNYDIVDPADLTILVTKAGPFSDVASDAWYAASVHAAKEAGIVNGIEGTTLFAPEKAVKRGDFMCMLYNLATNGTDKDSTEFDTTEGNKSFDDVAVSSYYATAIAWAKNTGIANGFGDGTFGPDQAMTREQGIAFISNFANAYGIDVEVAAADIAAELAKYPDGAKVSNWAKECVAWACIADVAGNGKTINPLGTITRAEAAAMLVNYAGTYMPTRL